jgi:hypothetical protein
MPMRQGYFSEKHSHTTLGHCKSVFSGFGALAHDQASLLKTLSKQNVSTILESGIEV